MSSTLTLWEIEKGIFDLYEALDEAETPEAREACEQALAEYFAREVVKVDAIRGLYRHFEALGIAARQEARDISARAAMFERRCERIKAMAKVVMEASDLTRLEGRSGRLLLKKNGGVLPLEVTDPAAVPDECCKYVGWIGGTLWMQIQQWLVDTPAEEALYFDSQLERVVDNERTRAALKTCVACGGCGWIASPTGSQEMCRECGGSGMGGVPGARLGERGKHVEVK